jgi:hypothetical protein
MSDTPETDGFFFKRGSWSDDTLAFCRKLERERDEAIREMNRYKRQWEESRSENVEGGK